MSDENLKDLHEDVVADKDWTKKPERTDGFRDSGDQATDLSGGEFRVFFKEVQEHHTPEILNITYRENEYIAHNIRYKEILDRKRLQNLRIWKAVPEAQVAAKAFQISGGTSDVLKASDYTKAASIRNATGGHLSKPSSAVEVEKWSPIETGGRGTHPDSFDLGKYVKEELMPRVFASPDIEVLQNFPDFIDSVESIVCEDLVSGLNHIQRRINDAIRGPIRLLNKLEQKYFQILRDVDNLESSLIDMIKSLEGPNLNIANLFNAYKNLSESCLFYNNLGQLDGMLEAFENIKNLADMTTPEFKNQLIDTLVAELKEKLLGTGNKSMGKILDDLIKDNVGSISQLKAMYWDMLEGAGVMDLLDQMAWLESCIRESCAAYKGLKGAINDTSQRYRDELGVPNDPNEPFDPIGRRWNNIKNRFGENWGEVEQKFNRLHDNVTDLDLGINKLKDNRDFFNIDGVAEFFTLAP